MMASFSNASMDILCGDNCQTAQQSIANRIPTMSASVRPAVSDAKPIYWSASFIRCKIGGKPYASQMIETGRMNHLRVVKHVDFGIYLDGGEAGEILMPSRYVPSPCLVGDELDVFIYRDSEDRLIATTERPYAMAGEFGLLKVVDVTALGAFLNWGLPKDLLVPFSEQKPRMEIGKSYVVRIYLDEDSDRIVASSRIDDFLHRESEDEFQAGEAVSLLISNKSDLGYQVIVDNSHWGLLHHSEAARPLRRGQHLDGFIRQIREDGRIDICLHIKASEKTDDITRMIMRGLRKNDGFIAVSDKSSPDDIFEHFGVSKKMYKKALGALYKKKIIAIETDGIRLL
jgi:predicted RNA-binding protein (virulence factor B family)